MTNLPPPNTRARGAKSNPEGRFAIHETGAVDDGWGLEEAAPVRTEVRFERAGKIISTNKSPDLSFDRSINTYRGCEHGCIYCYARPSHAFLDMSPGLDFETKLVVKPNADARLEKELSNPRYRAAPLAIGTNTDPYQPVELKQNVMRRCLTVLRDFKHPVTITTKGALIERDIDILTDMAAENLISVGISVTTLDADLCRKMEPRAPSPQRRLKTIERLAGAGVPVRVMASPMIPGLTDHELENILGAARDAGATHATWILLRLPFEVAQLFEEWLHQVVPDRAAKVLARVHEAHGGRSYDSKWFKRMRGEGLYAQMINQRYRVATRRLGLLTKGPELRCDLFRTAPRPGDQLALF